MAVRLVILGLLALLTWRQQATFASDEALWSNAVRQAPQLARPALNLATAYRVGGQIERAVPWFIHAGELSETDPRRAEYRRAIAAQLQWIEAFGTPVCDRPSVSRYCWP